VRVRRRINGAHMLATKGEHMIAGARLARGPSRSAYERGWAAWWKNRWLVGPRRRNRPVTEGSLLIFFSSFFFSISTSIFYLFKLKLGFEFHTQVKMHKQNRFQHEMRNCILFIIFDYLYASYIYIFYKILIWNVYFNFHSNASIYL
jgi:hypothetical protein